jgi:hypothetical protein
MTYEESFSMLGIDRVMPRYLYKYRNWSFQEHREPLLENYIYFPDPNRFNDKTDMDCLTYEAEPFNKHFKNKLEMDRLFSEARLKIPNLTRTNFDLIIEKRLKSPIEEIEKKDNKVHKEMFGVFSVSMSQNSRKHWLEYSLMDISNGFCIVYNGPVLRDILSRLGMPWAKVIYPMNAKRFRLGDGTSSEERLVFCCFQKDPIYQWEDEFRFVFHLEQIGLMERKFNYDQAVVAAIQIPYEARIGLEEEIFISLPSSLKQISIQRMPSTV